MESDTHHFETTDPNLASVLWATGARFLRAQALSAKTIAFLFADREYCERTVEMFWTGALTVNARDLIEKQRTLKDALFGKLREQNGEQKWRHSTRLPRP